MLHAVVMAGGSGTRFWPLSRRSLPKQFLTLTGDRSLIQLVFDRCQPLIPAERIWVATGESLIPQTRVHLPDVPESQILGEPRGRNTAPCIGLAALALLAVDPDAVMLVMPSDHVIQPVAAFQDDVQRAVELVRQSPDRLVLFGAPPHSPATGFGYIERGESLGRHASQVASFREKPDRATAERYVRAGTFFWNCGIFVWRADRILEALKIHEPTIFDLLQELKPHLGQHTWTGALAETFPQMKSISIDYAVLEREQNIALVEATFDWDDVGSWEAMPRLLTPDEQGNVRQGLTAGIQTENCVVISTDDHLVATLGLKGCIVVRTPDATLVAERGNEEAVRQLVALLQERGDDRFL